MEMILVQMANVQFTVGILVSMVLFVYPLVMKQNRTVLLLHMSPAMMESFVMEMNIVMYKKNSTFF